MIKLPIRHKALIEACRDSINQRQEENIKLFRGLASECGVQVDSLEYNTLWDYVFNLGHHIEFVKEQ